MPIRIPHRHQPKGHPVTDQQPIRLYTDDDLRAEAARQHADLTSDPDFVGVGEQMEDTQVLADGKGTQTWGSLLAGLVDPDGVADAYEVAQCAIYDLINGAADVSEWAVNLGADGLEPDGHTFQLGVDPGNGDKPRVRMHFAFAPDMDDADRDRFVMRLGKTILPAL